nr:YfiM family protein [Flavobacterium sp. HXWNR70]
MRTFLHILISLFSVSLCAQVGINSFLKLSDSINKTRKNTVLIAEIGLATTALVGLNQLWYKDYPRSDFHFINDNSEWLQMDKLGHFYSAYHLNRIGSETMNWAGASKKQQWVYGSALSLGFLTTVEIFDGFSEKWGASPGDIIANLSGTGLYVSQELLWKEQRIVPKFSFHTTQYAAMRPDVLGASFQEQILKDYNGQTYWLSVNLHSFFKNSKIPKWFNLALGYGGEGMVFGEDFASNDPNLSYIKRKRQFYLSFDADLTKIETKSHFLKTLFSIVNNLKIPAPTVKLGSDRDVDFYGCYF